MGLRMKLVIPFLITLFLASLIAHFVIIPHLVDKEIAQKFEQEESFLKILGYSIENEIWTLDLDALSRTLDGADAAGRWTDLVVMNQDNIQLYPVDEQRNYSGYEIKVDLRHDSYSLGQLIAYYDREYLVSMVKRKYIVIEAFFLSLFAFGIVGATTLYHRKAIRPLEELCKASMQLIKGDFNAKLPPPSNDELGSLIKAYSLMREELHQREQSLKCETVEKEKLLQQVQASLTKSEADLQARQSQWRLASQIVNNSPIATFVVDKDHRVTHWNKAAEKVSEYSIFNILGTKDAWKPFYETKRPTLADLIVDGRVDLLREYYAEQHLQGSMESNVWHAEDFFPNFGEGGKWLRFSGAPICDDEGEIIGAIETLRDITEERQLQMDLEERVEKRTKDLERSKEALQDSIERLKLTQEDLVEAEKMASLASLVGGVAHEVNTPLGVCITAATHQAECNDHIAQKVRDQSLKKSDLDGFLTQCHDTAQILDMNLSRAAKLIQSFKKVAVDQSSEEERVINLKDYIAETLTSLHPKLKKTNIEIKCAIPPLIRFNTYPGAISQIVTNLVMNSILHAFPDGTGTITLEADTDGERIYFLYSDDGVGMKPITVKKIFDPFFTTKRNAGGSGLGMHIVYNLVTHQLKGAIKCISTLGKGTQFVISFNGRVED